MHKNQTHSWLSLEGTALMQIKRDSRSSKVVDFGINRKRVCRFLKLTNNSNFSPVFQKSCRFSAVNIN